MGRSLLNDQLGETVSLAFNRFVGSGKQICRLLSL
jgi:hypothetical protein